MTYRLAQLAVSQAFIQKLVKQGKVTMPKKRKQSPWNRYGKSMKCAERRIERACREDLYRERVCKQGEVEQRIKP